MSRIAGTLRIARAIEAAQVTARLHFSPASLRGGRAAPQYGPIGTAPCASTPSRFA